MTAPVRAPGADGFHAYRERERSVRLSCGLALGGVVVAIVAALSANSVTLWAETLRITGEFMANVFAWLTVRKVARGNDGEFNYGYGKLENLATMAVAVVMLGAWAVITHSAINRLRHPVLVHGVELGLAFDALAAIANGVMWRRTWHLARQSPSPIMEAQWRLFRAKMTSNVCTVVSLSLTLGLARYAWSTVIDPLGSLLVSCFLLFTAYRLISSSMQGLLDRTLEEGLQLVIVGELADFFDRYVAFHGTRSRRSGGIVYIEIFLEFDGGQRMADVQRTIDQMRQSLERKIVGSVVAIVPASAPVELPHYRLPAPPRRPRRRLSRPAH